MAVRGIIHVITLQDFETVRSGDLGGMARGHGSERRVVEPCQGHTGRRAQNALNY
jgi:hypothetical protein